MAGVVLGDTPTVRAIHSDVTACTSGDKARRAKGKGGGVGVWSSSELGDLKETKAGEKKKEMNKKIIKENTKRPSKSKRRESECVEEQICDQAWCISFPQTAAPCWRTCCPQLLQSWSPVHICAANTLLQPLPGCQTQNVLWKILDFIPYAPSPSGSSCSHHAWWQHAAFDWPGSNTWGSSNSHCGPSQNSLLQWILALSNSSLLLKKLVLLKLWRRKGSKMPAVAI